MEGLERASAVTLADDQLDLQTYRKRLSFEFDVALANAIRAECFDELWLWIYDSAEHHRVRPVHELDPARFPKLVALHARVSADFEPRWK